MVSRTERRRPAQQGRGRDPGPASRSRAVDAQHAAVAGRGSRARRRRAARPDRALPVEDPAGRLVQIGARAAAFNVQVAAATLRYDTAFTTEADRHVRRSRSGCSSVNEVTCPSSPSSIRRSVTGTYRGPMLDQLPAQSVQDAIADAVRGEDATLVWLDADARDRLLGIMLEADVLESHDPVRLDERSRWVGGERAHDGVPGSALGPRPQAAPAVHRDLAAGLEDANRPAVQFERHAGRCIARPSPTVRPTGCVRVARCSAGC